MAPSPDRPEAARHAWQPVTSGRLALRVGRIAMRAALRRPRLQLCSGPLDGADRVARAFTPLSFTWLRMAHPVTNVSLHVHPLAQQRSATRVPWLVRLTLTAGSPNTASSHPRAATVFVRARASQAIPLSPVQRERGVRAAAASPPARRSDAASQQPLAVVRGSVQPPTNVPRRLDASARIALPLAGRRGVLLADAAAIAARAPQPGDAAREAREAASLVDTLFERAMAQHDVPRLELRTVAPPAAAQRQRNTEIRTAETARVPHRVPEETSARRGLSPLTKAELDRVADHVASALERRARFERERRGGY
jgi:hypothetical protein